MPSAIKWAESTTDKMRLVSPEINALPQHWNAFHVEESPFQIYYAGPKNAKEPNGEQTKSWDHPTLGPLPPDWNLCYVVVDKKTGQREPRYVNEKTKKTTKENPRFLAETLKSRWDSSIGNVQTRVASSIVKNSPGLMGKLHRAKIGSDPSLRDQYEIASVIDPGKGQKGAIGGMNGGVFVVRVKGLPQLYVEKRFVDDETWSYAKREITLIQRVRHGSLNLFCAGFIYEKTKPFSASVFIEYCDRGSLENIIKAYRNKRQEGHDVHIPERFLWHAFLGLADGFAYLLGGRSFLDVGLEDKFAPVKGWVPLLHRDMKPDNILLKSRSTLGANKYFYCILSDFGLACEDDGKDWNQQYGYVLGTGHYFAPELCWDPYPKKGQKPDQFKQFPGAARHTKKSDVWALGASIYNLAQVDPVLCNGKKYTRAAVTHLTFDEKPASVDTNEWLLGKASRRDPLMVSRPYSDKLMEAIQYATRWLPEDRPDAFELVKWLKWYMEKAGVGGSGPLKQSDKLPEWATDVKAIYAEIQV